MISDGGWARVVEELAVLGILARPLEDLVARPEMRLLPEAAPEKLEGQRLQRSSRASAWMMLMSVNRTEGSSSRAREFIVSNSQSPRIED
jgi:hypothetical protein